MICNTYVWKGTKKYYEIIDELKMEKINKEELKKQKLNLLKELIDRAGLLPCWYPVSSVNPGDFGEIHSELYENIKKIVKDLALVGTKVGEIKSRTERDLIDIEARLERFQKYVLNGFDLGLTFGMHELEIGDEFNNYAELLYGAYGRYNSFVNIRSQLQKISKFELPQKSRDNYLPAFNAGYLILNEEGVFKFVIDDLIKALDGMNVDKIRECKFCKRIFLAQNIKSKCCPPDYSNCNRNFNTRNSPDRKLTKAERYEKEIRSAKAKNNKINKE